MQSIINLFKSQNMMLPELKELSGSTYWTHIGLTTFATPTRDGIRIVDGYADITIPSGPYTHLFELECNSIIAITSNGAKIFKRIGRDSFKVSALDDYTGGKYLTQWISDDKLDYVIDSDKVTMIYNRDGSMGLYEYYKKHLTFGHYDQVVGLNGLPDHKKKSLQSY